MGAVCVLDGLNVFKLLLAELSLHLHLRLHCVEWMPDDGVCGSEQKASDERVEAFFVPLSPLVRVCHVYFYLI